MPIYEYRCKECQQVFEEWQKDFAEHEFSCPVCGGASERLISNTSFVLKGGGWYVTDYGRGNSGTNGKASAQNTESASSDAPAATASPSGDAGSKTTTE